MANVIRRLLRHLLTDRRTLGRAFPPAALDAIEQRVSEAEQGHGAEIRVAFEDSLGLGRVLAGTTARERALEVFGALRVWDTEANNGVLLYLLLADHAVEIVADRAAVRVVADREWREIASGLAARCARGDFVAGTVDAIARIDALLAPHFPAGERNPDELANRPAVL